MGFFLESCGVGEITLSCWAAATLTVFMRSGSAISKGSINILHIGLMMVRVNWLLRAQKWFNIITVRAICSTKTITTICWGWGKISTSSLIWLRGLMLSLTIH